MKPSAHLTWAELACKDGTPYPELFKATRGLTLAGVFETIREACGNRPIRVLSAYRSPEHNRTIGGARHSQHVEGRALDLQPPSGMTVAAFYTRIRVLAETDLRIGGVGRYRTFVHVDIRPRGQRVAVWSGSGVKDATA